MESKPRVHGIPITKSMLMSVQGCVGIGNGMERPALEAWPLDF